jgi:16S rRNA processing protein RimM
VAQPEEWVVIGKITGAHGIRGEVRVTLFIDDPETLNDMETLYLERRSGREPLDVESVRFHKGNALVKFKVVRDRSEAEQLRGREVVIPFEWLPALEEDEFYVAEIVGLTVETEQGEPLGKVEQVIFTGSNEVYVVRGGPEGEILLPAIESVINSVDLEAGRIVVTVPEGLLD